MPTSENTVPQMLERIITAQERQTGSINSVLADISEIKDSIRRLDDRLGALGNETLINTEAIKYINLSAERKDKACKDEHQLLWSKLYKHKIDTLAEADQKIQLAQEKYSNKLYATIGASIVSLIIAIAAAIVANYPF